MSLNTVKLKQDLKELFQASQNDTGTAEENLETFLTAFVAAVDDFVKSGSIVYTGGLSAGTTPVTGVFSGEIQ